MSGHSKWSQIKRQKGIADQKKGQLFTKLANAITIAVKQGGGITDPNSNFKLRLAIERARTVNMPKENIERAIERASGEKGEKFEEITYEGFGPAGIAILIKAATDNRQRTAQEIKNIFDNYGGNLAGPGATSYFFKNVGVITLTKNANNKSLNEVIDIAIEAGAEDFEEAAEIISIYTKPEELHQIREKLTKRGLKIEEAELTFRPLSTIEITDLDLARKVINFVEKLEENDSVQNVFANFEISNDILNSI